MAPGSSLGIVEAEIYNTGVPTPEDCTPLRSDDFNGGSLSSAKWTFRHPTTPASGENAPEVVDGKLRLRAVQGELPDGNISFVGQPLPPGDHWTVTTKLDFNPNAGWQHAGLMLYADNNNYARLTFTRSNANGQRFFELVSYVNGTRSQSAQGNISANHGNTAFVRLQRIGNQLSARYQAVGASFHTQGGVWLPQEKSQMSNFLGSVNLTTNTRVVEGAVIGPYAGGGVAGTNPVAEFDYFQVGPDDELALCGVDVTAPVSTAGLDPAVPDGNNGWYRTAPTVNIVASDDLDAEPDIEYRLADSGGFTGYTAPFTDNREGSSLMLQHRATDAAGNSAWVKTVNWKRDATAPVTEIEYVPEPVPLIVGTLPRELPDGSYSAAYSYRFDVEASDSLSGVESTEYCIGTHESPCDPEWPVEDGEIVIGGIGHHLVRYRSVDAAGNVEETREFSVRIVQHPHDLHVVGLPDTVKFGGPVSFFIDTDLGFEPLYDLPLEFVVNGDCTLEPAGDPIPDTGWPMRLVPHGAGSCTFTAHHPGAYDVIAPAESEPFTVTIGKAKPDVSVKISPKKVKSGKKLTVKVQVKAPGIVGGKVKVKVGGKSKTVKVNNAGKGTLKIKVKGKKGKKLKVQATYAGNGNLASAKSKVVKATFK